MTSTGVGLLYRPPRLIRLTRIVGENICVFSGSIKTQKCRLRRIIIIESRNGPGRKVGVPESGTRPAGSMERRALRRLRADVCVNRADAIIRILSGAVLTCASAVLDYAKPLSPGRSRPLGEISARARSIHRVSRGQRSSAC